MNAICPNCGAIQSAVRQQIGGRLVFGAVGAALGTRALRSPWLVIVLTILGYRLGTYLDEEVSRRCPQCGAVLRITGLLP